MKPLLILLFASTVFNSLATAETKQPTQEKTQGQNSFEYTIFIAADSKKVWAALVTPDQANNYYMCPMTKIDLKKGGELIYGEGMISGEITEIKEGSVFAHTFNFSHNKDEPETQVTYTLKAIGGVTAVTISHEGFAAKSNTYVDIAGGWPVIMSQLKTYLETGKKLPWPKPSK